MNAAELIEELRSQGVLLEAEGDRIRVDAPRGTLTPQVRSILAERKQEIIALLRTGDKEVAWRVEVMITQIPVNGPVPFLIAREAVEPQDGCCLSCGDRLNAGDAYRCTLCGRAANIALDVSLSRRQEAKGAGLPS